MPPRKKSKRQAADGSDAADVDAADETLASETVEGDTPSAARSATTSLDNDSAEAEADEDEPVSTQEFDGDLDAAAKSGVIKALRLMDFMCHRMLEIKFSKTINFIYGPNGSGKSAILSGIVLALGGKPKDTGRGKAVKASDFIRKGQRQAIVELELYNEGDDAFEPEKYGKVIHIHRAIQKNSSKFSILSSKKRKIGDKKSTVVDICDHFNIQMDNPISVLTQEVAKSFLAKSTDETKFKFFHQGTQLEALQNLQQRAATTIAQSQADMEIIGKNLHSFKKTVEEAEKLQERAKSLDRFDDEKAKLIAKITWAGIHELQERRDEERLKAQAYEGKIEGSQAKITKIESKLADYEARRAAMEGEIAALTQEYRQYQDVRRQNKAQAAKLRKAAEDKRREASGVKREIGQKTLMRDEIQASIDEFERNQQDRINQRNARAAKIAADIQQKESELRQVEAAVHQLEERYGGMEEQVASLQRETENAKRDRDGRSHVRSSIRRNLDSVKRSSGDSLSVWGPGFSEVENLMARETFSQPAFGPIGRFIRINDSQWAKPVEASLDNFLTCYLVDNHRDKQTLTRIFNRVFGGGQRKPTIFVYNYRNAQKDVRAFDMNIPAVCEVVTISNDIVERFLLDMGRMDSTFLCRDYEEGERTIWSEAARSQRGISGAFLKNGDEMRINQNFFSFAKGKNWLQRIGTDTSRMIRDLTQQLESVEAEYAQADGVYKQLQQKLRSLEQEQRAVQTELRKLQSKKKGLHRGIIQLQQLDEPEDDVSNEASTANLDRINHELAKLTERQAELENEVAQRRQEYEDFEASLQTDMAEEKVQRLEDLQVKMEKILDKVAREATIKDKHMADIDNFGKYVTLHNNGAEQFEKKVQEQKTLARNNDIEEVSARKSVAHYEAALVSLEKKTEEMKKKFNLHDIDQIIADFRQKAERLAALTSEFGATEKFVNELMAVIDFRKSNNFAHTIQMRTSYMLDNMLRQRGFEGKLDINFATKKLNLEINVHPNSHDDKLRDTKNLSGGEKSFSTMALLMALWEAMQCPIRCLDEFDVFMDMVNRQVTVELLVQMAKSQKGRQFILLSPLKIGQYKGLMGSDVRVHQLQKIDENQATLNM